MKQTFSKEERLCSHRVIKSLFEKGRTFHMKPFRITWIRQQPDAASPVQVLLSVPKYNFHKAVDRNLIRRRMREAYRLNKHLLYQNLDGTGSRIAFCITYTAKEIVAYDLMEAKIILLLQRLTEENENVAG
jgi:ribonuclease P protein component